MKTLSERLAEARTAAGLSQAALANLAGCGQSTIGSIERGRNQGSTVLPRVAEILGVSALWLAEGRGPMRPSQSQTQSMGGGPAPGDANVSPAAVRKGRVPVISWVQAGDWSHAADLLQPGEGLDWVDTSVSVQAHTFALRVDGDSMEPEFSPGTIVVVEPDMEAYPGDYVIAKNGDDEATFKQLVRDGADLYLKPLNPRYPIKPLAGARIVGVVREAVKRYR